MPLDENHYVVFDSKEIREVKPAPPWLSLPANAEDTDSVPDPGRRHVLRSNKAQAPQQEEPPQ